MGVYPFAVDSVDGFIEIGCNKSIADVALAGYEIVRLLGLINLVVGTKSLLERYDFAELAGEIWKC